MVVYLTKNLLGTARRLLATYNFEVSSGVYVGSYNANLYTQILDMLRRYITGKQKVLILKKDNLNLEGFSVEYINWESDIIDFDGVKLFKVKRGYMAKDDLND